MATTPSDDTRGPVAHARANLTPTYVIGVIFVLVAVLFMMASPADWYGAFKTIHVVFAVIWIGGLAFLVMAVSPGLQKAVAREQIKPITDVFYQHYKKVAGILLVILLFTGGINLHYVNQVLTSQTGSGVQHHAKYLTVFFIKLFLVLCLLTLFLYTVIFKADGNWFFTKHCSQFFSDG